MPTFKTLFRRADMRLVMLSQLGYLSAYLVSPRLALLLSVGLLGGVLALVLARLRCATVAAPWPARRRLKDHPFVSIQIATYSEPPEVVCKTLDTLAALDYPAYEVIVLDNNTPDPALYEPVRRHCGHLGSRFRFFHCDGVEGAKAGALNLATEFCSPDTEVILVLDADYCATPELLREGLSYFVRPEIALVQFPQAYRNNSENCGLTWEYRHFFNVYMNRANALDTVLSTGTALFMKKSALSAVGGWPASTLTEDAELGLRLHQAGLTAVYVPYIVSRGLMPTDLDSLRAQRRRWVLGNAQSLGRLLSHPVLSFRRKAMMFLQLTAWCNPLALCAACMATGTLAHLLAPSRYSAAVLAFATAAAAVYLAGTLLFFWLASTRNGGSRIAGISSYLVHLGMAWEGAVCWGEIFVEGDKRFIRTSKFVRANALSGRSGAIVGAAVTLSLSLWAAQTSLLLSLWLSMVGQLLLGRAMLLGTLEQIRRRTVDLLAREHRDGVHLKAVRLGRGAEEPEVGGARPAASKEVGAVRFPAPPVEKKTRTLLPHLVDAAGTVNRGVVGPSLCPGQSSDTEDAQARSPE